MMTGDSAAPGEHGGTHRENRAPTETQLRQLPTAHAVALRLRSAGLDDGEIARALGIDADTVPTLIDVALAKLAATEGPELAP